MKAKTKSKLEVAAIYGVFAIMFVIIAYPLLWAVGMSLNPGRSLFSATMIPENWSLEHFKWLFFDDPRGRYVTWYKNSLIVATATSFFSVVISTLTAYAFSRFKFVGRKNGLFILLVLQMFPILMAMVAIYLLLNMVGLIDNLVGLIIIYVGASVPMMTFLVKGYFDTVPKELDEAARIDGAGPLRVFYSIMIPLAKPIISVVSLFQFMTPFMDFLLPRIVLRSEENFTLALGLFNFVSNEFDNNFTRFAAGAILVAIPIAAVFLYLQRYLISGLTAGGTKG
ncbi:sugar ABC transporter permease [Salipaludibacillus agaradhaerens]|uniref:sugar ABC transporter permease n=1 Tax=Salipaludibacillus agaradhaerens TaxID=76935 RepID=UPI0023EECE71|nr:sugar ABC transporter permease [Salipaludibacillus agaradhaerens]